MKRRLAAEGGMTLVELIIVCALLGVVSIGIVNMLVSGQRAQRDTTSRVNAQQSTRLAVDKLEYEARCASQITSLNSGAGVALVLPAWCSHATGTVSWCVTSGTLTRYPASTCAGTGVPYVRSLTSPAPFTVKWATSATGYLPRLQISMTVNDTNVSSNAFTLNETLSLRNGGMQISATSGSPGSSVTITGTGMAASTALTVSFGSLAATITSGATTSSSGAVAATITVPFSGNGTYPITVSDGTTVVAVASRFTVINSFDGLMVTSATQSGGVLSCGNVASTTTCTAEPLGSTGNFKGKVTLETSSGGGVSNTSSALTISCSATTVASPGASVSPADSTIATGGNTTASLFTLTGLGAGWSARMTCSLALNGQTYNLVVSSYA